MEERQKKYVNEILCAIMISLRSQLYNYNILPDYLLLCLFHLRRNNPL